MKKKREERRKFIFVTAERIRLDRNRVYVSEEEFCNYFFQCLPKQPHALDVGIDSEFILDHFLNLDCRLNSSSELKKLHFSLNYYPYEQLSLEDELDGVWTGPLFAVVPIDVKERALEQLVMALKDGGVLQLRFKGARENEVDENLRKNCFNEELVSKFIARHPSLQIVNIVTSYVRYAYTGEVHWQEEIEVIVQKKKNATMNHTDRRKKVSTIKHSESEAASIESFYSHSGSSPPVRNK